MLFLIIQAFSYCCVRFASLSIAICFFILLDDFIISTSSTLQYELTINAYVSFSNHLHFRFSFLLIQCNFLFAWSLSLICSCVVFGLPDCHNSCFQLNLSSMFYLSVCFRPHKCICHWLICSIFAIVLKCVCSNAFNYFSFLFSFRKRGWASVRSAVPTYEILGSGGRRAQKTWVITFLVGRCVSDPSSFYCVAPWRVKVRLYRAEQNMCL